MFDIIFNAVLGSIFGVGTVLGQFNTYTTPKPVPEWSLIITGDVIPSRTVNHLMTIKNDFVWPIRNIAPILSNADITLINLEAPLIKNCPVTASGMTFCGDQRFVSALTLAGVDVVSTANNHILNFGWNGVKETEELLVQNNIDTTGITTVGHCAYEGFFCSKPLIKTVQDTRLGFLGYTIVGKKVDKEVLAADIRKLDNEVDLLIVSFHWGAEYTRVPVGEPDDPRIIGKLAVDNGADLVVGNHPHWIQGMEYYQDKPIFYALGNTIFDQEWSKETKEGIVAKLTYEDTELKTISIHPLRISNYGLVKFLEGTEKEEILTIFQQATKLLTQPN